MFHDVLVIIIVAKDYHKRQAKSEDILLKIEEIVTQARKRGLLISFFDSQVPLVNKKSGTVVGDCTAFWLGEN